MRETQMEKRLAQRLKETGEVEKTQKIYTTIEDLKRGYNISTKLMQQMREWNMIGKAYDQRGKFLWHYL